MKIRVVRHYSEMDLARLNYVQFIEVFVGKTLIGEFYDQCEEKLEGFLDALSYVHGDKLKVSYEEINDYLNMGAY